MINVRLNRFGNRFFTDLTHYVRSGDFVVALLEESRDLNENAFALGALAHYAADNSGHRLATRALGSMASALDSLNTIRNRGTLAHPNELLLGASEAMLYINLSRAVLAYVDSKLKDQIENEDDEGA